MYFSIDWKRTEQKRENRSLKVFPSKRDDTQFADDNRS